MKALKLFPLAIALFLFSCDSDDNVDANTTTVNVVFNHLVDGSPVELDNTVYTNNKGQEFTVINIKYFISDVKLLKADGSSVSLPDIQYVDIHIEGTLLHTFENKIPEGEYTGISFVYGLTPEKNISGRFPEPPESLMEWPELMGGGYHYMKLEGQYLDPNPDNSFYYNFHSGMLDKEPYEIHITMDHPFTVKGDNLNLVFEMEIQNWFKNPVDWDFTYFGPAIMGNHEAQQTIQKNGADVFSFRVVENNP